MAIDCSDLLELTPRCLEQRGSTVIDAVILQMLCNFNSWLGGDAADFTCDLDALQEEVGCMIEQGDTAIKANIALVLCELLVNLKNALGLCGSGSPEGVVTGQFCGQWYIDSDNGNAYKFLGTPGTNVGWN